MIDSNELTIDFKLVDVEVETMENDDLIKLSYVCFHRYLDMFEEYMEKHLENDTEIEIMHTGMTAACGLQEILRRMLAKNDELMNKLLETAGEPDSRN